MLTEHALRLLHPTPTNSLQCSTANTAIDSLSISEFTRDRERSRSTVGENANQSTRSVDRQVREHEYSTRPRAEDSRLE